MEYAVAILIIFNAIAYSHLLHVIRFTRRGMDYLVSLAYETPEKLGNNPTIISDLVNKQLPNLQKLVNIEKQRTIELLLAVISGVIVLYYPREELFTTFWGWVFFVNMIMQNMYMALMYIWMRRNKRIVSFMCNSYYNYKPPTEEDFAVIEKAIEDAFIKVIEKNQEEEMQQILDKVDDEHADDEQR
jgi:hypothetical protein